MKKRLQRLAFLLPGLVVAAAAPGCHGDEGSGGAPAGAGDLALGARGPEVEKVFEYLRRFGYFEKPELRALYPDWQPVVHEMPADPSRFDAVLVRAVRATSG